MDENKLIETVLREAKELQILFNEYQEKSDINSKSMFLKHIDGFTISKNIIPFLHIKDLLIFRTTCKEINHSVCNVVSLVKYISQNNLKHNKVLEKTIQQINLVRNREFETSERKYYPLMKILNRG